MNKLTLAAALLACSTAAHANTSGNELFSACRNFAYKTNGGGSDSFKQGVCSGIIDGASTVAVSRGEICYPKGPTFGQAAMTVVNHMMQHPECNCSPVSADQ
jgi:hypothetical protein